MNKPLSYVLWALALTALSSLILPSCREDDSPAPRRVEDLSYPTLLILNEGGMGSYSASIDVADVSKRIWYENASAIQNSEVKNRWELRNYPKLGDVGNDIGYFEGRIFAVINLSHHVAVFNAETLKYEGEIYARNCRSLAYHKGFVYLSSFDVAFANDEDDGLGLVYKINPRTLEKVDSMKVGYQPEEMAVVGDTLYVVNSGGYRMGQGRDNRLSVINLNTFRHERMDTIIMNMTRIKADDEGKLWIASMGDYNEIMGCLVVYDPKQRKVIKQYEAYWPGALYIDGRKLYASHMTSKKVRVFDTHTLEVLEPNMIKDGTHKSLGIPYGVTVHPVTKDVYVSCYRPRAVRCYSPEGILRWEQNPSSDFPGHFAWLPGRIKMRGFGEFLSPYVKNPEWKPKPNTAKPATANYKPQYLK